MVGLRGVPLPVFPVSVASKGLSDCVSGLESAVTGGIVNVDFKGVSGIALGATREAAARHAVGGSEGRRLRGIVRGGL